MASRVVSFQLGEELVSHLDVLTDATGRDRLYHIQRAMTQYLEVECRYVKAIEAGIAAADAGKLTDLVTVKAKWAGREERSRTE